MLCFKFVSHLDTTHDISDIGRICSFKLFFSVLEQCEGTIVSHLGGVCNARILYLGWM